MRNRKWQDYVYIQCKYKSTKQKIKHLLREENKVIVFLLLYDALGHYLAEVSVTHNLL